jgi:hypothetical protein
MAEVIEQENTFSPEKQYTWNNNDVFTLSGQEFGLVLNALRATISTPEAARILLAVDAHDALEGSLARAVQSGQVKEVETTPTNSL